MWTFLTGFIDFYFCILLDSLRFIFRIWHLCVCLSFLTQGRAVRWLYSASSSWPPFVLRAERPSTYRTAERTPDDQVRRPWPLCSHFLFCVKEVILILVQMQTFREAISILVYVRYLINTLKRVLITLLDMCKHRRQSCWSIWMYFHMKLHNIQQSDCSYALVWIREMSLKYQ